ncbi:MAG: hypothetical protein MK198_13095 [Gracilimonas sp.]|uniref:hypothetical protein n=1 Tax=Gracilimonas sp. TaxID=1974203 RepID=UPI003750BE64|nr:hypothetical protein [Gracilimonas sp.]
MRVKIKSISDSGNIKKERIVMKVLSNTNIGNYSLFESETISDGVTTSLLDVFWFPDKKVEAGDLVVLYTKSGNQNEKQIKNGNTAHFFYWESNNAKWKGSESAPVLLEIADWQAYFEHTHNKAN